MDLWMSVWSNPPYYCYKLFGPGWSVGYLWPYYSSPFGVKIGERFEPRWWFCWNRVESPPVISKPMKKKEIFWDIIHIHWCSCFFYIKSCRCHVIRDGKVVGCWVGSLEHTLECMRCHREFAMVATVYWYGIHMNCWARVYIYIYIYRQRLDIFYIYMFRGLNMFNPYACGLEA